MCVDFIPNFILNFPPKKSGFSVVFDKSLQLKILRAAFDNKIYFIKVALEN